MYNFITSQQRDSDDTSILQKKARQETINRDLGNRIHSARFGYGCSMDSSGRDIVERTVCDDQSDHDLPS